MRRAEQLWEGLCARRGLFWALLLPLSQIYALLSRLSRLGKPKPLHGLKVISVGNLSMGGTGKSPLVILIAKLLKARRPAVITRGYGDDEVMMLGQVLPFAQVIMDSDRRRGAAKALEASCKAAILDDGFQRRHQLARDLDILVLDWSRSPVEHHCLPAGRLREPLTCAAEADAVVVTHAPEDWNSEALRCGLPLPYRGLRVFRGDHVPTGLLSISGKRQPLGWLKGREITALSAIGRPEAFEESLRQMGAIVTPCRFPDHHAFAASDIPDGVVVCTAKDAVKIKRQDVWILEMELKVSPQREFEALIRR